MANKVYGSASKYYVKRLETANGTVEHSLAGYFVREKVNGVVKVCVTLCVIFFENIFINNKLLYDITSP